MALETPGQLGPMVVHGTGLSSRLRAAVQSVKALTLREWVCHALACVIGFSATYAVYLLMDRAPVITITNFHIIPDTLSAGQKFILTWFGQEHRAGCGGEVSRYIIVKAGDFRQIFYYLTEPTAYHAAINPEKTQYFRDLVAPAGAPEGPATLVSHTSRWCNILQQYLLPIKETYTAHFTFTK